MRRGNRVGAGGVSRVRCCNSGAPATNNARIIPCFYFRGPRVFLRKQRQLVRRGMNGTKDPDPIGKCISKAIWRCKIASSARIRSRSALMLVDRAATLETARNVVIEIISRKMPLRAGHIGEEVV